MEQYKTPARTQRFESEVKRSRFITSIASINGKSAAKAVVAEVRTAAADASHHCWATISGAPDDVRLHDQSDDGEPRGTAGKPMLNVLQHSGLGNIVVVVTRYYGGVKLGTGGLVRAYTRAVSEPLKSLDTVIVRPRATLSIDLPYAALDVFEHWLKSHHTEIVNKTFTRSIALELLVPAAEKTQLLAKTRELGGSDRTGDNKTEA
jgi:uncharacterized YigZ family protein